MNNIKQQAKKNLHVGLFVTCLVDLFRPQIGFVAVKLLENAGCRVSVPLQTCSGQPAYNNGDNKDALGCLLNMAGKLQRCNHSIKVLHVAEILADMADGPGIGEALT